MTDKKEIFTPTEYLMYKINKSGIKINLNKEEMKRILEEGKNIQKMSVKYGTNQNIQQNNKDTFNGYGTYIVSINEENAKQFGVKLASRKYGGTFYIDNEPFNSFLKNKNFSNYWNNIVEQYQGNSIDELTSQILNSNIKGNQTLQREKAALSTLLGLDLVEYKREKTFLYSIEIPDNDNTNYLLYNNPIGLENSKRINEELERIGTNWRVSRNDIGRNIYFDVLSKNIFNGNQKQSSEFLKKIGYVGMQMDNSNYIVFSNEDMKITNRIQFMKDKNEEIYGFTFKNQIYIDENLINSNVLAHEYTHIWDNFTKNNNPELWQKGIDIFKGTSIWMEIVEDKNYENLTNDDDILSECHARIVGKMAETVLKKIEQKDGKLTKDTVINWDKEVSEYIVDELLMDSEKKDTNSENIKNAYLEQFLSMPMKDLMECIDITKKESLLHSREMAQSRTHGLDTTFPEIAQTAIPQQASEQHIKLDEKISQSSIKRIEKINTDKIYPEDFLRKLKQSFECKDTSKSYYVENRKNNENYILRLSDHSSNTYKANKKDIETSIVIELSKHSFINDKEKTVTEYIYFPIKLTPQVMDNIKKGITDWIETGNYTYKKADIINETDKAKLQKMTISENLIKNELEINLPDNKKLKILSDNIQFYKKSVEKNLLQNASTYKNILNKKITENLSKEQITSVEKTAEREAKDFNIENQKNLEQNKSKNKKR